jgi:competence protein ComEC
MLTRDYPSGWARNPLWPLAIAVVGGIVWARQQWPGAEQANELFCLSLAASLVLLVAATFLKNNRLLKLALPAALSLGFFALGGQRVNQVYSDYPDDDIVWYAKEEPQLATVTGVIITDPYISKSKGSMAKFDFMHEPRTICTLACETVVTPEGPRGCRGRLLVVVSQPAIHLRLGDRLEIEGRLSLRRGPSNPGQYDYRDNHRRSRCLAQLRAGHVEAVQVIDKAPQRIGLISRLRHKIQNWASLALLEDMQQSWSAPRFADANDQAQYEHEEQALQAALILGQRHGLQGHLNETFIRCGALHFLSVSGLHVGILAGFIWWLSWFLRLPRWARGLLALLAILTFLLIVPPRAPVLRAGTLCAVFCIAYMFRRQANAINVLALGALIILLTRPLDLFNPGFQLSFVVVLAIIIFVTPVVSQLPLLFRSSVPRDSLPLSLQRPRSWYHQCAYWVSFYFWGLCAVCVIAWFAGMPLAAYHFHRIAPWGMVASMVMFLPILAHLLLGYTKLLLVGIMPTAAEWLSPLMDFFSQATIRIAEFFAALPSSSTTTGPLPLWLLVAFYALLGWLGWILMHRPRQINSLRKVLEFWSNQSSKNLHKPLCIALSLLVIWAAAFTLLAPYRSIGSVDEKPIFHILSVGHGTCVIGELSDGSTLCYDAGSLSNFNLAESVVIPFLRRQGIGKIDRLFLSHANLDHYNGVIDLCRNFPVGEIYLSDTLNSKLQQASRYSALGTLSNYLNELNHVTAVHKGTLLPLRPNSGLIEVLWPPPARGTEHLSTNDCSLVLRVQDNKRSFLLTGDIGDIPQKQITSTAEVLLLPHHGSANSGLPEFVETVAPQCIVNSCGFLEPRRLKKLDQSLPNRRIWHTFQSGCISVFPDSRTTKVMPFRDTE